MPFTSDVAAFAKREHAYRTRLAGLMILVLVLALIILPALIKSELSSSTSEYRLLGLRDLCERERDDCRDDPDKTKPGVCGCGIPDTDTDGDGTPDCKDGCPRDASKKSPGICGCGVPDTDADTDGDGKPDCIDDCVDNDPVILNWCRMWSPHHCEGCGEKYYRVWTDCSKRCFDDIDYCLGFSSEARYEYVNSFEGYRRTSFRKKGIQSGADSSNTVWEIIEECDIDLNCVSYDYLNGVWCDHIYVDEGTCLQCDDGNEYCVEYSSPTLPSSPFFWLTHEASMLLDGCNE